MKPDNDKCYQIYKKDCEQTPTPNLNRNQILAGGIGLFTNKMIIICNSKPVIGEIEMKIEKRPRNVVYFQIEVYHSGMKIAQQKDIKISLLST